VQRRIIRIHHGCCRLKSNSISD